MKSESNIVDAITNLSDSQAFTNDINVLPNYEKLPFRDINVEDDVPTFDEHDLQDYGKDKRELTPVDEENKRKFIKSLSPEFKAETVFASMQRAEGARTIVGHEKRIYIRKLIREAKKGRLDKYFM